MKIYVPSDNFLALEVAPSAPLPKLHPKLHIEVPNGWHAVFSSQKNTLTLEPQVVASLSELESRLNSVTTLRER